MQITYNDQNHSRRLQTAAIVDQELFALTISCCKLCAIWRRIRERDLVETQRVPHDEVAPEKQSVNDCFTALRQHNEGK